MQPCPHSLILCLDLSAPPAETHPWGLPSACWPLGGLGCSGCPPWPTPGSGSQGSPLWASLALALLARLGLSNQENQPCKMKGRSTVSFQSTNVSATGLQSAVFHSSVDTNYLSCSIVFNFAIDGFHFVGEERRFPRHELLPDIPNPALDKLQHPDFSNKAR